MHASVFVDAEELRRRTVRDALKDRRDKENILYTCCAPCFIQDCSTVDDESQFASRVW